MWMDALNVESASDSEVQDSDYYSPSDGDREDLLYDSDELHEPLDLRKFTPSKRQKLTLSEEALLECFNLGKRGFEALLEKEFKKYEPEKEWYYRNGLFWEIEDWSKQVVKIAKRIAKGLMHLQFLFFDGSKPYVSEDNKPTEPVHNQKSLKIKVTKWWLSVYVRIQKTEWRIPTPVSDADSRPILYKPAVREVYEQWKAETMKKMLVIVDGVGFTTRERKNNRVKDGRDEEFEKLWEEAKERSYLVNYPDLDVDDSGKVYEYPKKEIPGSGLELAKSLNILHPSELPTSDGFPSKYWVPTSSSTPSEPQVGDVPIGFPTTINKFTDEDIFWLVAFYNDSFALEFRDRCEYYAEREHVFEVWWHLSWMAGNAGKPPPFWAGFEEIKEERMAEDGEYGEEEEEYDEEYDEEEGEEV